MIARLGILGGTFNPPHLGHLILAQDAAEHYRLDRVLLVPCHRPPHKDDRVLVDGRHRAAMIEQAVAGNPLLECCRLELERGGISYSVDTLAQLRELHPRARFFFIIGGDSLTELHTWRDIGRLLEGCEMVTMLRPGFLERIRAADLRLPPPWPQRLLGNIFTGHALAVSSSEIRRRVAERHSIRYLVPAAVEQYIQHHHLYAESEAPPSKPS